MPDSDDAVPLVSRKSGPVDSSILEMLGNKAADMYLSKGVSLNDAITKLASGSQLSAEHIRRVVEFANKETHNRMFKESEDKLFSFPLADSSEIVRDMNDGGTTKVPVRTSIPQAIDAVMPKVASTKKNDKYIPGADNLTIADIFKRDEEEEPVGHYKFANPTGELSALADKMEAAEETLASQRTGISILLDDTERALMHHIKQASLEGLTMRDIYEALHKFAANTAILKEACVTAAKSMKKDLEFVSQDQTIKTASGQVVSDHPLVEAYKFYETLVTKDRVLDRAATKIASMKRTVDEELRVKLRHAS
jgi:hypothetical protein